MIVSLRRRVVLLLLALLALPLLASCIVQAPQIREIDPRSSGTSVRSPVKVHLLDGSTVIYDKGLSIYADTIRGDGVRFAFNSRTPSQSGPILIDSVVGMEAFQSRVRIAPTVLLTSTAIAASAFGTAVALVAIFGSCPTYYTDSSGVAVLEGEGFSYSIAPLFEQRDVDRLRPRVAQDGRFVLEVRNEALETHYINHLELLEVAHAPAEDVFPDAVGRPVAVQRMTAPLAATDAIGRDVSHAIAAHDGVVFSSAESRLASASEANLQDYIDLTIPNATRADTVVLVLRLRNSLLNTVLLYQEMLGGPGARSLDWIGRDLASISGAIDLGRWYSAHMGMRISVGNNGTYRQVARLSDTGPIAFHEVAVPVPTAGRDRLSVRLSFIVDQWRIDRVAVAESFRRAETRVIPVTRVETGNSEQDAEALGSVREPDEDYLVTSPSQRFNVVFDVTAAPPRTRTYMLASQGYYIEWVRGSWIKHASGVPFEPSERTLLRAVEKWRARQNDLEQQFFASRIPVR